MPLRRDDAVTFFLHEGPGEISEGKKERGHEGPHVFCEVSLMKSSWHLMRLLRNLTS
jgi:hypothetical protein